jgi:hypothetical protein
MVRYEAAISDAAARHRSRYRRWGVWDRQRGRWVAQYRGEFAKSRAQGHARELNAGGLGAGWRGLLGGR